MPAPIFKKFNTAMGHLETAKSNLLLRGTEAQKGICETLWHGAFKNQDHIFEYLKVMASMYSWKIRNNEAVTRARPSLPYAFDVLNEGFRTKFWHFNFKNQLGDIQCPTLVLVGEEDWITDLKYSKEMAQKIPNSVLQIFKNADHSMESDVPELFFNAISQFIH